MNQENIQVIEKHISNLGFADVYAFALEQLILSNQKVLEETNSRIDFLRGNMNWIMRISVSSFMK